MDQNTVASPSQSGHGSARGPARAWRSRSSKLKGKQPKLKPAQDRETRRMHDSGDYNVAEVPALFNVSRPTVYRSLQRTATLCPLPPTPGPRPASPSTTNCSRKAQRHTGSLPRPQ